jgi:hypothetical protein
LSRPFPFHHYSQLLLFTFCKNKNAIVPIIITNYIFIAAFGQSSTSPFGQTSFGAQQGFGQPTTATNNPFAPKPFGSQTTTFEA